MTEARTDTFIGHRYTIHNDGEEFIRVEDRHGRRVGHVVASPCAGTITVERLDGSRFELKAEDL